MLRDLRVWQATIVVDVGGTYEPEKQRFDHHQKTFVETYSEVTGVRLVALGLSNSSHY